MHISYCLKYGHWLPEAGDALGQLYSCCSLDRIPASLDRRWCQEKSGDVRKWCQEMPGYAVSQLYSCCSPDYHLPGQLDRLGTQGQGLVFVYRKLEVTKGWQNTQMLGRNRSRNSTAVARTAWTKWQKRTRGDWRAGETKLQGQQGKALCALQSLGYGGEL